MNGKTSLQRSLWVVFVSLTVSLSSGGFLKAQEETPSEMGGQTGILFLPLFSLFPLDYLINRLESTNGKSNASATALYVISPW
jgi:hypothetical protein